LNFSPELVSHRNHTPLPRVPRLNPTTIPVGLRVLIGLPIIVRPRNPLAHVLSSFCTTLLLSFARIVHRARPMTNDRIDPVAVVEYRLVTQSMLVFELDILSRCRCEQYAIALQFASQVVIRTAPISAFHLAELGFRQQLAVSPVDTPHNRLLLSSPDTLTQPSHHPVPYYLTPFISMERGSWHCCQLSI